MRILRHIFLAEDRTINEFIEMNKTLVVGYSEKDQVLNTEDRDLLWDNVEHQWGNKQTVEPLLEWFDQNLCQWNSSYLRSAMAQVTPEQIKEIFLTRDSDRGLRVRADWVNPLFARLFYDRWPDCVNIITADYFLGSGVIDIAINLNKKKFSQLNYEKILKTK